MGADLWAFKIKESSKNKDAEKIWWEDEDDDYLSIDEMLPNNYFSKNGFSDNEWALFDELELGVYGDPYMSNESFVKSVNLFNKWYSNNNDKDFELSSRYRTYTVNELKDLHEYLNKWAKSGHGLWLSL